MSSPPPAGEAASAATAPLAGARPSRLREDGFRYVLLACLGLGLLTLAVLLVDIAGDGVGRLSLQFLYELPSRISPDTAGVGAAIMGTVWCMVICAVFIVPVGVATAVYLEEFANRERWHNRFIEVNIQNLAAVPSIVYGILGLAFLVRGPLELGTVVLAGGLTLGLLVLPVVIVAAREAIRAVPPSIREGSMALGATQWQTVWKQVLPAAIPGIATGTILALSRAIGETAPLIVVGAAAFLTFYPSDPLSEYTVLPIQIFNWAVDPQDEFKVLAAAAIIVLMAILLAMNAAAIWLRNKYEKKW